MSDTIRKICDEQKQNVIRFRRDLHKYPEIPATEYRTACKVVQALQQLGYEEIYYGDDAINIDVVKDLLPSSEEAERCYARALSEGADPVILEKMKWHKTAVMAVLRCGEGPVVGLRTDMDALHVIENDRPDHIPNRDGFDSVHPETMHACGHDGHTAMGIGVAAILKKLADENKLHGTVKLFFQPGEEASIGGYAMCEAGIADDLDYLLAIHIGVGTKKTGQIGATAVDFPSLEKYDVHYEGLTSHSGVAPEKGHNALLAACTAVKGIYGLSRSSKGWSRVNCGTLNSGIVGNAVPGFANMEVELRAANDEVMTQLSHSAKKVLEGAAIMYECDATIASRGTNVGAPCDPEWIDILREATAQIPEVTEFLPVVSMSGAGEDATRFMRKAQANGGKATYMMIGSSLSTAPHTANYDLDEDCLAIGTETVIRAFLKLLQ